MPLSKSAVSEPVDGFPDQDPRNSFFAADSMPVSNEGSKGKSVQIDADAFVRELREQMRQNEGDLLKSFILDQDGPIAAQFAHDSREDSETPRRRNAGTARNSARYAIIERVAAGGMGVVYRVRDLQLDREVALKVLFSDFHDPRLIQRFETEARVLAQLQHPGITPVYEEGSLPDNRAFIAMKLVGGHTLWELLEKRSSPNVDVVKYLGIFKQICETVAYAHSNGILHRDLKPSNVMVGEFGEVQVIDWGLAKQLDSSMETPADITTSTKEAHSERRPLTQSPELSSGTRPGYLSDVLPDLSADAVSVMGEAMGTPSYMPPEQAQGLHDQVSYTSDVFSLGGILCKILTGEELYDRDTVREQFEAASEGDLSEARERIHNCQADDVLKKLATDCLQVDPNDRPQSASEIVELLDTQLDSLQNRLWKMELARTKEIEKNRRRKLATALVVCASLMIAVITGAWATVSRGAAGRLRSTVETVARAIGEAELLRDTALSHPLDGEQYWLAANKSVRRAEAAAHQASDHDLTNRIADLSAEIKHHAQLASQDRQFIEQLTIAATPVSINEMRKINSDLKISDNDINLPFLQDGPDVRRMHPRNPHGHPPPLRPRDRARGERQPTREDRPMPPRRPPLHNLAHGAVLRDRYVSALTDYGFDPRHASVEKAVQYLLERPEEVRERVISGMHCWFGVLIKHSGEESSEDLEDTEWALDLLEGIDLDLQRNQIRQFIAEEDIDLLLPLLSEPELLNHPPSFLWLISQQLMERQEGFELLSRTQSRYPSSLLVNEELANFYDLTGQNQKAITAFMCVLAVQKNAHTYVRMALTMRREGRTNAAILMCQNAIRLSPAKSDDAYPLLAKLLLDDERYNEVIEVIDEARSMLPEDSKLLEPLDSLLKQAQDELAWQALTNISEVSNLGQTVPTRAKSEESE